MPRLIIDALSIEVPEGTKVIDAAERLGIMIPRFCYHPALGSLGACRLCAVKFLDGPLKGVQMSCMVDAADGMVVSTTDPEAVEFRKYVIEWLMLHHPHDCPVCDEGGHCLLQDETVSGGHGLRRYLGKKRTYHDQHLGPFVQHEMNRCIHCFRCRRFYQEFAGYRDLGAMQIGNRMYFGRFSDGPLESPFAGNLIDVCPTGVYTDKPSRYRGRRWDFERGPSICLHCSLGCNTITSARYREIIRQEARVNEAVNGHFICDRGRFGYDYANHPARPRRPRVGQMDVSWDEALSAASEALARVREAAGPEAIASFGSTRSSVETQAQLLRFCRLQGLPDPHFFEDPSKGRKVQKAVSRLDGRLAVSLGEIQGADLILGVGVDPVNEAPMLALAMRQASRSGATIAMMDPRPLFLPFDFHHLPVAVDGLDVCLGALIKATVPRDAVEPLGPAAMQFYDALPGDYPLDASLGERLSGLARKLTQSQRPLIVCGTDIVRETTPDLAADCALLLRALHEKAGLFYVMPGPNAFGAALFSFAGSSAEEMVQAMEKGNVKALILVECDPLRLFPDRERLLRALAGMDLLLLLDYLPSSSARHAHIVLPTLTVFERIRSSFINQEGRLQVAWPIHEGGSPIAQISGGSHPPRAFLGAVPGGEPKPAVEILGELAAVMSVPGNERLAEDVWTWLARENALFAEVSPWADHPLGARALPQEGAGEAFSAPVSKGVKEALEGQLELLVVDWTFGTEALSSHSRFVHEVEKTPHILMHVKDASRLGLPPESQVVLHLPGGTLGVQLRMKENMAQGVIVMPRHRQLDWQKLKEWPAILPASSVERSRG